MKNIMSTTSSLAMIEAWNEAQRELISAIPADWATRYFAGRVLYVRTLSEMERDEAQYDTTDATVVWYGAFQHLDSSLVAVSDSLSYLYSLGNINEAQLHFVN